MSAPRVLAIAGGLCALVATFVGLALRGADAQDAGALLASTFHAGAPPVGFALAEATSLPSGEVLLRLERTPEAPSQAGPEELLLVRYPTLGDAARLFRDGAGGEQEGERPQASLDKLRWEKDPSFSFHTEIESGRVAWDRWQANYRVERVYRKGGGWQELSRVNLGQKERALVLFARWPAEIGHDRDELERLVRTIAMLPPEEEEP